MTAPFEASASTPDGVTLVERHWPAADGAGVASVLIVHGIGEHARRYDHVAAVLNGLGLEVRSFDHRGFGRSGGKRGALPHANALVDDTGLMFDRLAADRRDRGDREPPFILGHSMGGCIVARAVTGGTITPRGMVLSSPGLRTRLSRFEQSAATVFGRLLPNLRLRSRLPMHLLSHDPAVFDAVRADGEMHDFVTSQLAAFIIAAGRAAIDDSSRCRVPTLLLVAGDDHLVDPAGAREFFSRLPPGVGTFHVYERLYHEIFNEPPEDRKQVFADLTAWMSGRLAAR